MYLTIIKDSTGSTELSATDKITNSQKLIVSTALNRFAPFQYVLVPLGSQTRILCQIIKKPDMHEHFCYLNTNVVCAQIREHEIRDGFKRNESHRFERRENLDAVNVGKDDVDVDKLEMNIEANQEEMDNTRMNNIDSITKACALDDVENSLKDLKNKGANIEKFEINNEREMQMISNTLKASQNYIAEKEIVKGQSIVEEVPGGSDRGIFNENFNVFEEFTGNKIDVKSIIELGEEVEHCKRVDVSVVVKKFYGGTNEEFNRLIKQILTMYTFTAHSYINVHLENIHSIIIHDAAPSLNRANRSATSQTAPLVKQSTPTDTKTRPPMDFPSDSCSAETHTKTNTVPEKSTHLDTKSRTPPDSPNISSQISSTLPETKSNPPQNSHLSHLLFVSPKTKLTIQATYSVDYYKQLIHFGKDCGCVEEYVQYNDTWRCMQQLIECRKRGLGSSDEKRLNSANKILLTGLSGSGKSHLVRTLARALSVPLVTVSGNEFSSPSPGVAERSLADTFQHARGLARENKGLCILLFEQIHELVPASPSLSHIIRLSLSLTRHLDSEPPTSPLFFIFTSTAAHSIDSRLKTHAHLYLTAPDIELRRSILEFELGSISILNESSEEMSLLETDDSISSHSLEKKSTNQPITTDSIVSCPEESTVEKLICKKSINEDSIRDRLIKAVLEVTGSYLPVDLIRVARVVMMYLTRHPAAAFTCSGLISHVLNFISHYRPSCLQAGSLGVIDLPSSSAQSTSEEEEKILETGEAGHGDSMSKQSLGSAYVALEEFVPELGGLSEVRAQLEKKVEWPFKHAAAFERLGIPRPKGILLYGPPGCAKTSLVRQLALRSSCRVLAVSAAQLYSPYVGEAEANVAQVFHRARSAAPAILFIDEIDALVGNRSESSTKDVQQSVLSVFLNEMDGVGVKPELGMKNSSDGHGVLVIAATNRPTALDSAILRPGRLDSLIYVRPPDERERREILGLVSVPGRMSRDVDLNYLAAQTELYSGADLTHLYREAALISLLDRGFDNADITQAHWLEALRVTRPSLTRTQLEYYEEFERSM